MRLTCEEAIEAMKAGKLCRRGTMYFQISHGEVLQTSGFGMWCPMPIRHEDANCDDWEIVKTFGAKAERYKPSLEECV